MLPKESIRWQRRSKPAIPLEMARWGSKCGGSVEEWLANVQELRDIARRRPQYIRHDIIDQFGLAGTATLLLEPAEGGNGSVSVNSILPTAFPWHGTYFQGVPVTLHAESAPGYRFAGWSDSSLPTSPTVTISLPEYYKIQARFVPIEGSRPTVETETTAAKRCMSHQTSLKLGPGASY